MAAKTAQILTCALAPWFLLAAFLLFPSLIAASVAHAQTWELALAPFTPRQLSPGIHLLATPPDYLGPAISNVTIVEQSQRPESARAAARLFMFFAADS